MERITTEKINGREMALGAMALSELMELAKECHNRMVEAQVDYQIVQYTIDYRFPKEG